MENDVVLINRAPVLTLWAAVVAERLGYDYAAALSLGKALAGLNARLAATGHAEVEMARFRPNLVLDGLEAHDEDRLDVLRLTTGEGVAELRPVKPCARCPIPNVDPLTAESSPVVSDTLQVYRQDPRLNGAVTFGMNAIVLKGDGQVLRVGQAVTADFRFD